MAMVVRVCFSSYLGAVIELDKFDQALLFQAEVQPYFKDDEMQWK